MKFKPKEIMVNLPAIHLFASEKDVPMTAAAINTIVHGKVKIKYEILGTLGGQVAGLFYVQRNHESQQIRDEFMQMILEEETRNPVFISSEKKDCEHNWVMDGHNAGNTICSKCLKEE